MCVDGPLFQTRVVLTVNQEPMKEDKINRTDWKGNIHNAEHVWMISLKDTFSR